MNFYFKNRPTLGISLRKQELGIRTEKSIREMKEYNSEITNLKILYTCFYSIRLQDIFILPKQAQGKVPERTK